MKRIFVVLVLISLALALPLLAQETSGVPDPLPLPVSDPYLPQPTELQLHNVYQNVVSSVVNISIAGNNAPLGAGSGFVIDNAGHIVTNNHVVESATHIEVTFSDNMILTAQLIGRDSDSDLAVIRINPEERGMSLNPLVLADSNDAFIG